MFMKSNKLASKKVIAYSIVLLAVWFSIHTSCILIDGLRDEGRKSDLGVVLGNTVNKDGSLSTRLKKRLDKAIELYSNSVIPLILVSGGLGKEGFYEGDKMAEYLIANGIPSEKIIIDNHGNTTIETAENVKRLPLSAQSITIITQYYHISRTKLAFRKVGYKDVKGVHANFFELRDGYSIIREFVGYYRYYVL